jgi:S1-C subfamily serine protease
MGKETKDPDLSKDISDYLNSERLHVRMNIHHGDSGSPAVNASGEVVGVVADRVSGAHALIVPADKLRNLLSSPEDKFNFVYESDAEQNQHLLAITRKDGSTLPPIILEAK